MQFLASLGTFDQDAFAKAIWKSLSRALEDTDGICYYKHPVIAWANTIPDLTVLARDFQPLAIRCMSTSLDELIEVADKHWVIAGETCPSPLLDLDDYVTGLQQRFDKERDVNGT